MPTTYNSISDYEFFKAGEGEAGSIVGYSAGNRVVRYKFTAPDEGASALSFTKKNVGDEGALSAGATLRWYVTNDPDSHKDAGPDSEYHGEVTLSDKDGTYYTAKGSADNLVLLPGETYYLFVFPGTSVKKYYWWNYPTTITLTLSGAAGLVWIHNGTDAMKALLHIYTDGTWKIAIPYIHDGIKWKICS